MDIVHHACIGGIGMATLAAAGHEVAGAALLAGTVVPDLDVFFMLFGKRAYLKNHQGPSHSLVLAPVIALIIALPLFTIVENQLLVIAMSLLGVLLHIGLDWTNTFGIGLFWPVKKIRFSRNGVFFVDLCLWGLTLTFGGILWHYPSTLIGVSYFTLFSLYMAFKLLLHRRVCVDLGCLYAIPSSINPFSFYITELATEGVTTYLYHTLKKSKHEIRFYPQPAEKHLELAQTSPVFRDMKAIVKHLYITNVVEDETGTTITASDIAVRNYGGKFGKTLLRFDNEGKLLTEKANI